MTKEMQTRAAHRGFTLLEIVMVVAIVGVLGALAFPLTNRLKEREGLQSAARIMVLNLRSARTGAASGRSLGVDATGRPLRVRSGGIRVVSDSQYVVFIDSDGTAGGEQTVRTVDFLADDPSSRVRIVAPAANQEVRFNANGTLTQGANTSIRLRDETSQETKEIQISLTGFAQLQ